MEKISQIVFIIFVANICCQVINGEEVDNNPEKDPKMESSDALNYDDPEVKDAVNFAFGSNLGTKVLEFTSGKKKGTDPNFIYSVKVKIVDTFECTDDNNPETNQYVTKTDRGCQSSESCTAEVLKLNKPGLPYRMDGMQCTSDTVQSK